MLSDKLDPLLTILNKPEPSENDLQLCVKRLNEVILDAAKMTFPSKKIVSKMRKKNTRRKTKVWFTTECVKLRKTLRKHSRTLAIFPFDRQKLHQYLKIKSEYKRTCRKAERQ